MVPGTVKGEKLGTGGWNRSSSGWVKSVERREEVRGAMERVVGTMWGHAGLLSSCARPRVPRF